MPIDNDEYWMAQALTLAEKAQSMGEVPVGAVVVIDGKRVGQGWNQPISGCDPSAHAEIMALRHAAKAVDNYRLVDADLYVTLEPCAMCAGAIVHARIKRLIFGAFEPKAGVACSQCHFFDSAFLNHSVDVVPGVLQQEASDLLTHFFKNRRKQKKRV